ncbi:MAG TPA: glycine cleavage system protein GcvH [Spirochaetia bacterium]|nr:glycine cleavage system protein GcvH [Spirochaetia bacterium]
MTPKDLMYSKEHEWVRIEGKEAVIGISDYAQEELGDITFVELPDEGREVKKMEMFATIESVKAASDIFAPLSGKIVKVNENLTEKPEIINESPYEEGWICRILVSDPGESQSLMSAAEYDKYLKGLEE